MLKFRIKVGAFSALLVVVIVCLAAGAASAQTKQDSDIATSAISTSPSLTGDGIKSKIEEIGSRKDLNPAQREQALDLYRTALSHLESMEASRAAADKFQEALQVAPARTAKLKEQLSDIGDPKKSPMAGVEKPLEELSLEDAEELLDNTQAELAALQAEFGQLEAALDTMASRSSAARAEQSAERQALDEPLPPSTAGGLDELPLIAEARSAANTAERMAREARINQLEQELISLPARQALATANRDLAAAKLELLKARVSALEARISTLRQSAALAKQEEAEQAKRQLAGQSPVLEDYAQATAAMRQDLIDLTQLNEQSQPALAATNAEIARIKDGRTAAQEVLEIGTVGEEFGVLLREMRAQLPSEAVLLNKIRDREEAIVEARLGRLKADKSLRALADTSAAAVALLAETYKSRPDWQPEVDLLPTVEKLIADRRDALESLIEARARRVTELAELNAADRSLLSQTVQLESLLNNRLLWLPSSAPVGRVWAEQIGTGLIWMTDTESWRAGFVALGHLIISKPFRALAVFGAVLLFWLFKGRLMNWLAKSADRIGRPMSDGHFETPRTLLITAVLALPLPLVLGFFGWLLTRPPEASEFAGSVGYGFLAAALVVYGLRFLQLLCLERGALQAHFNWSARACRVLKRNVSWLMPVAVPAVFVLGMIEASNSQVFRDGLGRLTFVILAAALAVFAIRITSPRKGAFAEHLASVGSGSLWNTRGIWQALMWLVPIGLGGLAVAGFYDGAVRLLMHVAISAVIVAAGLLAYGVVMREVLVARQRLEIRRALKRRQKVRSAAIEAGSDAAGGDAVPHIEETDDIDVASVSQQIRTLLRMILLVGLLFGLWIVWREMVPTLGLLDGFALWTQSVTSEGGTKIVSVTLSNFLTGLVIAIVTMVAARNLPGVLEIMFLQRLEPGTRYAVKAVARYSIICVGLIAAFESLGADWSQLQWIVAALGVGVGFGLQEIVANFICGLIILFERPVRVGDTVTIGDLSGTVSRIQMRATSITDWDNREILVPNKVLITENVTNWTLTDAVTRVVLKVGIAYGSDIALAQKLMMEVVEAAPLVIDKPAPSVLFLGFGDSSLDFEVRAFVVGPNHRLPALHDLHVGIERVLREHNIQIPFPQRDLHLHGGGNWADIAAKPVESN